MKVSELASTVKQSAIDAGFDVAGISGVRDYRELDYFPEWIESGYGGEMQYLAKRDEQGRLKRSSLSHAAPWARSVVVCAINYNSAQPYSTEDPDPRNGWISRYGWSQTDYHDVVLKNLRRVESELHQGVAESGETVRTWCYVDTGPLVERVYAKYAGIGWIGKNACIINQQLGSWLFLGVILTSLELAPDLPAADRCGTCTRCLDACPTDAFLGPHQLDATKCISYLTIEKRGAIPEELREGVGRHVYGCDICQDVCPWNRKAPIGRTPQLAPRQELVNPSLEWLAGISVEEFRELFRDSPVKRAKYQGLRRNVVIALGNSGDLKFAAKLETLANDPDENLAEHSRWALRRLRESATESTAKKEVENPGK
ncbi:MAG TPA: tRNA epoxyqueuosine(34) reductase QueG [Clostridia bacterium]|nr:tRNA epoxyqueuosine(34) reductase QueG [Clostridia bacterium]